jgi:hypothetical protein
MAYIHMEGLLTARTIWGENSWLEANQVDAEHFLRQGHERMIKASEMMSGLRETVLLSRARVVNYYFFSPLTKACLDIFNRPSWLHQNSMCFGCLFTTKR